MTDREDHQLRRLRRALVREAREQRKAIAKLQQAMIGSTENPGGIYMRLDRLDRSVGLIRWIGASLVTVVFGGLAKLFFK